MCLDGVESSGDDAEEFATGGIGNLVLCWGMLGSGIVCVCACMCNNRLHDFDDIRCAWHNGTKPSQGPSFVGWAGRASVGVYVGVFRGVMSAEVVGQWWHNEVVGVSGVVE